MSIKNDFKIVIDRMDSSLQKTRELLIESIKSLIASGTVYSIDMSYWTPDETGETINCKFYENGDVVTSEGTLSLSDFCTDDLLFILQTQLNEKDNN